MCQSLRMAIYRILIWPVPNCGPCSSMIQSGIMYTFRKHRCKRKGNVTPHLATLISMALVEKSGDWWPHFGKTWMASPGTPTKNTDPSKSLREYSHDTPFAPETLGVVQMSFLFRRPPCSCYVSFWECMS